jgi:hypothetical protein
VESDWTEGTVRRVYSAGGRMGKGKRLGSEESRWGGGDAGEGRTGKGLQIVQPLLRHVKAKRCTRALDLPVTLTCGPRALTSASRERDECSW